MICLYICFILTVESLAESRERIEEHEGIFGVEKETWNKALKQQTKITLILMDEQEREYTYRISCNGCRQQRRNG